MTDPADEVPADMKQATDAFYEHSNSVVNSFAQKLSDISPPPVLYHYTNGEGLRGILESGKLWLNNVFNLNDPSELRHGVSAVLNHLERKLEGGAPELKLFTEDLASVLNGAIEEIAHFFVCCLSHADDDLGQWRAYADNGRGFALGFDGKNLEDGFCVGKEGPIAEHATFPVTYDESQLNAIHEEIVSNLLPLVSLPRGREMNNRAIAAYMKELSLSVAAPVIRAALFFKHKGYRNEEEYRFLEIRPAGPVPDVKFRGRPYSLIRYREFDWRSVAPAALRTITIGPAADPAVAMRFVNDCRRAFHADAKIEILRSEIPYRAS